MNDFNCSGEKPCDPQLNEGERLYTSHLVRARGSVSGVLEMKSGEKRQHTCSGSSHGLRERMFALV